MALFRPRELRPGTAGDDLLRQLNEIQKEIARDIAAAFGRRKMSEVVIASTYAASFGEVVRIAPPSGGTRLVLPAPNLGALDSRITAVVEAASGALSVEVVDGLINGSTTLTYLAGIGTVEFVLTPTGWYGWSVSLVASFPIAGLAAIAANTFLANPTASSAVPTEHPFSTLAGAGLTYASGALAVGAGTGLTVAADAVGLTDMAARRIKLRADSAGTGAPTDGTGAQAGEILRLATINGDPGDSTSTGTIQTYTLTEAANVVRFLVGIAATTLRGATIPSETGKLVIWENNDGTGVTVTLNHEDASAAAAGNRFRCPGAANYALADGHRIITCYINQRHRIVATA